jgi:succinate dehydrogenase / fumarate reductase iron-sulfur subunit
MVINGSVRLACRTFVDEVSPKGKVITLEPLEKFPLVRDLVVDRVAAEQAQRELRTWVELDSQPSERAPTTQSRRAQRRLFALGQCIDCGACLEVCPEYGRHSDYLGAAALSQAQRLNETPVGRLTRPDRLSNAMAPGGIAECGKALACVEVCPVGVPLVDALQSLARDTTREMLGGWLLGHGS